MEYSSEQIASSEWLTTKLYSPLLVQYFEVSDSEYLSVQRISELREVSDSTEYIDEITDAIKQSTQRYGQRHEFFVNMNVSINDNIVNMEMSVEIHNNHLWGVAALQHKYPFSPTQINALKQCVKDEYKNGWGNQFKYQNIVPHRSGHYRLNVCFWQDTAEYSIMSEDEFRQVQSSDVESSDKLITDHDQKRIIFRAHLEKSWHTVLAEFPMSDYEVIQTLYKLQCDRPDAEYTVELDEYSFHGVIYYFDLTGTNIYELNYLAELMADFDDYQDECFDAYIKAQENITIKQLINAAYNIDNMMWHTISNDKELGEFALENDMFEEYNDLPDDIYAMLDKEKAGVKLREMDGGKFVNGGYLVTNEFKYDGIDLPDKNPLSVFKVCLCYDNEKDCIWLDLPATESELNTVKEKYNVSNMQELYMCDFHSSIPYFKTMDCKINIEDFNSLNELATVIKDMDEKEILKFKAVLETEQPFLISDAAKIIGGLDHYSFDPHLTDPNDYGRMMVCEKFGLEYDDTIMRFIDNTKFGSELMKRNGMTPTQYGAVSTTISIRQSEENESKPDTGQSYNMNIDM